MRTVTINNKPYTIYLNSKGVYECIVEGVKFRRRSGIEEMIIDITYMLNGGKTIMGNTLSDLKNA